MYDNGYGTDPYGYQPQPQPRPSRASSFLRTVLSVLVLVVLVVLLSWGLRTFVFQAYEIPSGSMEETIMPGDMVFSEKITYYGSDPAPSVGLSQSSSTKRTSWAEISMPMASREPRYRSWMLSGEGLTSTWNW